VDINHFVALNPGVKWFWLDFKSISSIVLHFSQLKNIHFLFVFYLLPFQYKLLTTLLFHSLFSLNIISQFFLLKKRKEKKRKEREKSSL